MERILRRCGAGAVAIAALVMAVPAEGQVAGGAQPETVIDVLHQLADKADIVFAGQVVAIRRPNDGVVEVEFRVDQAIRGCTAGAPYILHEWAGLWPGDNQRYRVGQRLLMLLHAPSAAGMSSPVGGLDGAIPIRQGGAATSAQEVGSPRQPAFVDLRWLGARVPRVVSYRNEPIPAAKAAGVPAPLVTQQQRGSVAAVGSATNAVPVVQMAASMTGNGSQSGGSVAAQQVSVAAAIGMLTSWQKVQHVAP
jgi:hypothetical protein